MRRLAQKKKFKAFEAREESADDEHGNIAVGRNEKFAVLSSSWHGT